MQPSKSDEDMVMSSDKNIEQNLNISKSLRRKSLSNRNDLQSILDVVGLKTEHNHT